MSQHNTLPTDWATQAAWAAILTVVASLVSHAGVMSLSQTLGGQDRRAQGTGQLRIGGNGYRFTQEGVQSGFHAGHHRHAAGEDDRPGDPVARHGGDARGDRCLDAGDNVLGRDSRGQQADDFGFGKDDAHTADYGWRAAFAGHFAEARQPHSQPRGHDLQKMARSRGATIVHDKIAHAAIGGQSQEFAVLAADIDDGSRSGNTVRDPGRLTSNFGDRRVGVSGEGKGEGKGVRTIFHVPLNSFDPFFV